MRQHLLENDYFEWLCGFVCSKGLLKRISYRRLLIHLHNTEFIYILQMDENRADDGIRLRYRYALEEFDNADEYLRGPCSVLEMMIALSISCEEQIMYDPSSGDRTGQWFWEMIVNLGLGPMTDTNYDEEFVNERLYIFMNRLYKPNGKGGLFTIKNPPDDMRNAEIWHQLCWYLNTLL